MKYSDLPPSLHPSSLRPFIFAGVFFGLSAYTYLSSRALPILLAIFTLYLALFARKKMRGKWRGLFVCFIVAGCDGAAVGDHVAHAARSAIPRQRGQCSIG